MMHVPKNTVVQFLLNTTEETHSLTKTKISSQKTVFLVRNMTTTTLHLLLFVRKSTHRLPSVKQNLPNTSLTHLQKRVHTSTTFACTRRTTSLLVHLHRHSLQPYFSSLLLLLQVLLFASTD